VPAAVYQPEMMDSNLKTVPALMNIVCCFVVAGLNLLLNKKQMVNAQCKYYY